MLASPQSTVHIPAALVPADRQKNKKEEEEDKKKKKKANHALNK